MSTKKRLLILSAIHVAFFMLFVIIIVFSSRGWLENIQLGLQFTYSFIFPVFAIIFGIVTRLISTRPSSVVASCLLMLVEICGALLMFNILYPTEDIEAINGMNSTLSIFEDIGPSYLWYVYAYFATTYVATWFGVWLINKLKNRRIVKKLATLDKKQTRVDNPMYLKSYNKKTNKYEKYLIWITPKGKVMSSEKIIYFDIVELIAVDNNKNIYAMLEKPQKITIQDYLMLKQNSQQKTL